MRTAFMTLILILCFAFSATVAFPKDDPATPIPIQKGEQEQEKGHTPRSMFLPITCYYSTGTFQFSFYETYSEVEIKILNTSTNEEWSYFADDFKSLIRIPVSSNAGTYLITIYADTDYYTGVFLK